MERLGNNGFEKENQPNNGPEISLDFINAQLQSYSNLFRSQLKVRYCRSGIERVRGGSFMLGTKKEQTDFCTEFNISGESSETPE